MTVTKFMLFLRKFDHVYFILNSNTTHKIFLNAPEHFRREYVALFDERTLAHYAKKDEVITAVNEWHPYKQLNSDLPQDRASSIFGLIKDNEIDHLKALIDQSGIAGVSYIRFSYVNFNENALTLADGTSIDVTELNPILLAIKYRSVACLQYLIDYFGVRQSMIQADWDVRDAQHGDHPFKNLMVPLVLQTEDVSILDVLLKNEGFVLTKTDFNSFVSLALKRKWSAGLRTFLSSPAVHFFFTTLTVDEQKIFVERVVKFINDMQDVKTKKTLT